MKKSILFTSLFAGMIGILFSCAGEYPGFKKTKSGIYYKIHVNNTDGAKVETDDVLSLTMVYRTVDSVLFDSRMAAQPMTLPLSIPQYPGDIFEALALLKVGDSATFILDAEDFFYQTVGMPQLPQHIAPGSKMYFDVKVNKAISEAEMEEERNALKELRKDLEPKELAEYLEMNQITAEPIEPGYYYIEHQRGTGNIVKPGDLIKAHFFISTVVGDELYSSYDAGEPLEVEIGRTFDNVGVTEALQRVRKGTKATIIVPSEIAFGPEGRGDVVPPYTTMVYDIEVMEVISKEEADKQKAEEERLQQQQAEQRKANEKMNIQNYLKENNLDATPTASGLYYIEQVKGDGPKPQPGNTVKVHYTGTLLNGNKFDSSVDRGEPFEFTLGMGQVIRGWDEGIAMMNVGSKGLLIIPSELGYGSRSMGPQLPANSTLVFEVELLGFE